MFTGIIQAIGRITDCETIGGDRRFTFDTGSMPLTGVNLGESIAVNGVCLTAVYLKATQFAADVSTETLDTTTLGRLAEGARVNLERSLTLADPLGGHLVSGHVDGVGRVTAMQPDARSTRFGFEIEPALARYVARKGSITIDGTSLTVNDVSGTTFSVNIVPHTLEATIMGGYVVDTDVNIEVDLVARYLERLLTTKE